MAAPSPPSAADSSAIARVKSALAGALPPGAAGAPSGAGGRTSTAAGRETVTSDDLQPAALTSPSQASVAMLSGDWGGALAELDGSTGEG